MYREEKTMSHPNRKKRFFLRATATGICCLLLAAGCGERRSQQQTAIADTNLRIGNVDAAMAAYRQALDENPGNIDARLGLARCHVARNESDAALEAYEAVVAADPARAEAYIEPVELMLGLGAVSGAQRLAESFAGQDPERGGLLLARVEMASDNPSAAVTRLGAMREQFPDSMPVLVMLSRALLDAGRAGDAEAMLAEAARDDSPPPPPPPATTAPRHSQRAWP
jgi:predicted Zn-dependent protease